jgi:hypothetical protein
MYLETFYAVGQASMCWNPPPDTDKMHNFQPEKLEKIVDDQNIYVDRLSELIELSNNKIDYGLLVDA